MANDFKLLNEAYSQNRPFVTGGAHHWPMVDKNGTQLRVGDKIRYQFVTGRYGQTAIRETTVLDNQYDQCTIEYAHFRLDMEDQVLRGYYKHNDFEHGHETWVEVIERKVPRMPEQEPYYVNRGVSRAVSAGHKYSEEED